MKILLIFVVSVFVGQSKADTVDPVIEEIENNITAELYGPLDRVLVCLNQEARNQLIISKDTDYRPYLYYEFSNINIEYHEDVSACHDEIEKDEQQARTIIAVVTPKPFKLSSDVPMYFYDIPYLLDDDADAFPNGLTHVQSHWQLLKHAFIQHINSNGWKRIAIVSDYSEYSEKFETELVDHFEKSHFAYNVQRCVVNTTGECNFDSALKFLETQKAVIIIANVEGRNAQNLMNAASALPMGSAQFVWLVRGWPFQDTTSQVVPTNILSITMSPKITIPTYPEFHYGPHFASILGGLKLISEAISVTEKTDTISKYYKSIFQKMNNTQNYDYKGYIRSFTSGSPVIINTLDILSTGVTGRWGSGQSTAEKIADFEEHCMLRSSSFTSPCDDNWIMLICVVWLMFILMIFLLILFFNRCLVWT